MERSKLEKSEDFSVSEFQTFLTQCLYCNYPEFKFHKMKADEINDNFYDKYPEFKIRFKPHYTWKGKTVVEIGIRATNEYCCIEKEERKKLLTQYGFNLEKDVRSSVPRLTLSINTGHWIDEDIDIYKLINDEFAPDVEFTEEYRDILKEYVLPTYFEEGSDKMLGKNATYTFRLSKREKAAVDAMLGRLRRALVKAVGGRTFGSEIFYIESCIYIMTLYDLLTSHHMVWLVYDAFYSNGEEDQETYETMLREGFVYLSVIKDLYDNFVVAYKIGNENNNHLVYETVKAAKREATAELQLHSDQGFQYTSDGYFKLTQSYHITPPMSSPGTPLDNACAENFFSTLKSEWLHHYTPATKEEARLLLDEYIHFYNYERIQLKTKLTPYEKRCQFRENASF